MVSNVQLMSMATGFSEMGIKEIISRNRTMKLRYSTLANNYRKALDCRKNVSARRKTLENHLERDGMIILVSRRNSNSEFLGNVLNLNEDGIYNLRILHYLLSRHDFLVSTALALGRKGEIRDCWCSIPSYHSTISSAFCKILDMELSEGDKIEIKTFRNILDDFKKDFLNQISTKLI